MSETVQESLDESTASTAAMRRSECAEPSCRVCVWAATAAYKASPPVRLCEPTSTRLWSSVKPLRVECACTTKFGRTSPLNLFMGVVDL